MTYSPAAQERRRCTGTRRDGAPCRAWALWDDPRQLCLVHAGRHHRGPLPLRVGLSVFRETPARYVPCTCAAYQWPHRPGGGLCRWPDPPRYQLDTPAGTHSALWARRPRWAKGLHFRF